MDNNDVEISAHGFFMEEKKAYSFSYLGLQNANDMIREGFVD